MGLKNQINSLQEQNNLLQSDNKSLKEKLAQSNNNYNILKQNTDNIINNLKYEYNKLSEKYNQEISSLKNNTQGINNDRKIIELMEEIRKLKSNNKYILLPHERLMAVIVISLDQKVHNAYICKNTDQFNVIERQVYEDFPELKEQENFFLNSGMKINRYKTMDENKIKNSSIIQLNPVYA